MSLTCKKYTPSWFLFYNHFFFAWKLIINIFCPDVYDFEILAYTKTMKVEYTFFILYLLLIFYNTLHCYQTPYIECLLWHLLHVRFCRRPLRSLCIYFISFTDEKSEFQKCNLLRVTWFLNDICGFKPNSLGLHCLPSSGHSTLQFFEMRLDALKATSLRN